MTESSVPTARQQRAAKFRHTLLRVGVVFFLFTSALLFLWKWVSDGRREEEFIVNQNETLNLAEAVTNSEAQSALATMGDAVGAVVRRLMLQGDLDAIRAYFRAISASKRILSVTLMRNDGKIVASSERQREGASMSNMFRNTTSALPGVFVDGSDKDRYLVLVPIDGPDTRLGLVIIGYERIPFADLMALQRSAR